MINGLIYRKTGQGPFGINISVDRANFGCLGIANDVRAALGRLDATFADTDDEANRALISGVETLLDAADRAAKGAKDRLKNLGFVLPGTDLKHREKRGGLGNPKFMLKDQLTRSYSQAKEVHEELSYQHMTLSARRDELYERQEWLCLLHEILTSSQAERATRGLSKGITSPKGIRSPRGTVDAEAEGAPAATPSPSSPSAKSPTSPTRKMTSAPLPPPRVRRGARTRTGRSSLS